MPCAPATAVPMTVMFVVTSAMVMVVELVTVTTHTPFHALGVAPVIPIVLPDARPCADANTIVPLAPVPDEIAGRVVVPSHTPAAEVALERPASMMIVGRFVGAANYNPLS